MKKVNNKKTRKIKKLIILCALMGITFIMSTYAWFVGLREVRISNFNVDIKTADTLMLSLNGTDWSDTLEMTRNNFSSLGYSGNTNSLGGSGLIPMSSIGQIDKDSSTMKIYAIGNSSENEDEGVMLKKTAGGYRLNASRVENYGEEVEEQKGYVAFDLFIKNYSGEKYYTVRDINNEEAIYLTTDSKVTGSSSGVANTGLENSVRVAFAEIGRINANETNLSDITGITCHNNLKSTGICTDAVIWEPNEENHVEGAIKWYSKSCMVRTGNNAMNMSSYSETNCQSSNALRNGEYYPTFAVVNNVYTDSLPTVDVYDGYYNNFENTVSYFNSDKPLYAIRTFTDSDKNYLGVKRPTLFTLAPNSITKVRVYIWLEGQDIDNYDYASAGKAINLEFGFEKQRYTDSSIPPIDPIDDSVPPTEPINLKFAQVGTKLKMMAVGSTDNIAVDGYQYSIDDSEWSPTIKANRVYEVDNVSDTDKDIPVMIQAVDKAGNKSSSILRTVSYQYVAPPDTEAPTKPQTLTVSQNGTKILMSASGSTDNVGVVGYQFSFDTKNWSSVIGENETYEFNNTENLEKEFTIYAIAVDEAGNESLAKSTKFNYAYQDLTAPSQASTITITQSTLKLTIKASGATDNVAVAGYKFSLDNSTWSSVYAENAVYNTANLENTNHTVTVYCKTVDTSGNESTVKEKEFNFVHKDLTAPSKATGMLMIPVSGGISVKASGSTDSDSGLKGYKYSKDNSTWSSVVASGTATTLSGATTSNTFYVKAVDNAGNESAAYSDKITVTSFSYNGTVQSFTAPKAGSYILEVWGAQGGKSGGKGGYAKGTISLTASKVIYVAVGAQGNTNGSKAYNGGGAGNGGGYAGDGGGATHMAYRTGVLSSLASYQSQVIIVAGGGGGTSEQGHAGGTGGGTNGGEAASTGLYHGYGGTQSAGGGCVGNYGKSGSFGQGGDAETLSSCSNTRYYGAGGGGGWYGGGGGGFQCTSSNGDGGGGGGSGYLNTTYLSSTSMSNGQRTGNGYATITYIGK